MLKTENNTHDISSVNNYITGNSLFFLRSDSKEIYNVIKRFLFILNNCLNKTVSWAPNDHIRMTGSRDTDDRSNDCWKFSHLRKK